MKIVLRSLLVSLILVTSISKTYSQRYLSDLDSMLFIKDTVRPLVKRFENLRFTGYIQPQFQVAESDGAPSFEGGNFSSTSKSRFMLRRARIKLDYFLTKDNFPKALFTFQIDATERGVNVRDMFIKLYEPWVHNFSMTAGLFARPFGYEVNLSSSFRETPERGRMSQILMPSERDLGVMFSFEPLRNDHNLKRFKLDAGFFNGQGLSGTTDFDNHKDFISRFTIKPHTLNRIELSGGLSLLRGGWTQFSKYVYRSGKNAGGENIFVVDSSESNIGKASPRHYYGGDAQIKINHGWGATELRGEYWFGTQPGTSVSTTNPGTIPTQNGLPAPTYIRHFDGAFFYFIQSIVNEKHQLLVKYDWYDPNTRVELAEIGKPGTNLTIADIKFSTLGFGYVYHFNPQIKLVLYYSWVENESTLIPGMFNDLKDNVFTSRIQFKF